MTCDRVARGGIRRPFGGQWRAMRDGYTTNTGEAVYVPLQPFVIAALKKIERPNRRSR